MREEFFAVPKKEHHAPLTLLITGGSRGALPINRAVVDSLDLLVRRKNRLFIVHQTGERDYNAVRVAYARREFKAEVVPFIANMAERFAQADLILCRSGAITVAEVSAAGRAAIFIPFGAATAMVIKRATPPRCKARGCGPAIASKRTHPRAFDEAEVFLPTRPTSGYYGNGR